MHALHPLIRAVAWAAAAVAVASAFTAPLAQAQIQRWTDAQGKVHYGDNPPPGASQNVKSLPKAASPTPEDAARARAEIERSRQAPRPEVVARPPAVTASSPASAPVDNSCLAQWRRYVDASACFDPCRTRNGLRADCAAGCQEVRQPYCRLPDAIKRELQNRP